MLCNRNVFRGNCHPTILNEMRKYYPKPHFLPNDCEIPSKEYVFMGYEEGATMHVCYFIFMLPNCLNFMFNNHFLFSKPIEYRLIV